LRVSETYNVELTKNTVKSIVDISPIQGFDSDVDLVLDMTMIDPEFLAISGAGQILINDLLVMRSGGVPFCLKSLSLAKVALETDNRPIDLGYALTEVNTRRAFIIILMLIVVIMVLVVSFTVYKSFK